MKGTVKERRREMKSLSHESNAGAVPVEGDKTKLLCHLFY